MSVRLCLALLALLAPSSLTAASEPDCDKLLKPLEDQNMVYGKWIFYTATSDNKELLEELRSVNSSWMELSPLPDSDDMTLRMGDKVNGECHYGNVNSTFNGNFTSVTFNVNTTSYEHVGKHLLTCPDCLLWADNSTVSGMNKETIKGRNLYLFTKSGTLDASHLEVFKKQAACLNLLPEFHFGETDLCPDDKAAATEEEQ